MGIKLNVRDGETIHQRCLLVTGTTNTSSQDNAEPQVDEYVAVTSQDMNGDVLFPDQHWPHYQGNFKALLILEPGVNQITFTTSGQVSVGWNPQSFDEILTSGQGPVLPESTTIKLNYVPMLSKPPLYLAILVGKDSLLQVDCPPVKYGSIASAHTGLDAVIAKFRMTAYMWQAFTAEDLLSKKLGRRTFRLEEEWAPDTLSRQYHHARRYDVSFIELRNAMQTAMRTTAKVHLVHTDHTVAELRDARAAKTNKLHEIFTKALHRHGGVFAANTFPVVAGLILDSHESFEQNLILGHAAHGVHNPYGLSLGTFGSHLTYSWPRYVEEITECLMDTRLSGDLASTENRQCLSLWETCALGQGGFLQEVGHALSANQKPGIMEQYRSRDWPKAFLPRTADRMLTTQSLTQSFQFKCTWDIRDALRLANLHHFHLPGDKPYLPEHARASPSFYAVDDAEFSRIKVESPTDEIVQIYLNGVPEFTADTLEVPESPITYTLDELRSRFDHAHPLEMEVLCKNATSSTVDVWKLFSCQNFVLVPGTHIRLLKESIDMSIPDENREWKWAVMLKKRGTDGKLYSARKIDLRVGCQLDGAVVHYHDGSEMNCGPRFDSYGHPFGMGGHQSRKLALPSSAEITKVQVSECGGELYGLRMHLSNGNAMGALNKRSNVEVHDLVPPHGHKVIGFYGTSDHLCTEFGIITAPRDVELPDSMWDLPELNNTDGGRGECVRMNSSMTETMNEDISQDEDDGYDYAEDTESMDGSA